MLRTPALIVWSVVAPISLPSSMTATVYVIDTHDTSVGANTLLHPKQIKI